MSNYFNIFRIVPIWVPCWSYLGKKSLYGVHVRPEWANCRDSAHKGPIYTFAGNIVTMSLQRRCDIVPTCLLGTLKHS